MTVTSTVATNHLTQREWTLPDSFPKTPVKTRDDKTTEDLERVQKQLLAKDHKKELLWNLEGLSPYQSLKAIAEGHEVEPEQVRASIEFLKKNAARLDQQNYLVTLPNRTPNGAGSTSAKIQFENEPGEWNINWTGATPTISNINNHDEYQEIMMIQDSSTDDLYRIMYSVRPDDSSRTNQRVALDYNFETKKLTLSHNAIRRELN